MRPKPRRVTWGPSRPRGAVSRDIIEIVKLVFSLVLSSVGDCDSRFLQVKLSLFMLLWFDLLSIDGGSVFRRI